jgi:predicted anti-sigma-YlaC factor YlaD
MNPCPRYEESLILYSYQELGRKKVVTLQKHLAQCERCRSYLDGLNHVSRIIENHFRSSPALFLDIQW